MFPIGDENQGKKATSFLILALIAINVVVFLYEATLSQEKLQDFVTTYGVVPREIENGQDLFTLITSMFVHGGWAHLGGNMLFLWIFGDNIDRRFGPLLFILLYLAWGLAASVAHIITNSGSDIPSVGASGAIAGVMGSYILLFPTNKIRVLIARMGIAQVPAFLFLGIWFVTQLVSGVAALNVETAQTSGIAFWAHIGGFVAGALAAVILRVAPTAETA